MHYLLIEQYNCLDYLSFWRGLLLCTTQLIALCWTLMFIQAEYEPDTFRPSAIQSHSLMNIASISGCWLLPQYQNTVQIFSETTTRPTSDPANQSHSDEHFVWRLSGLSVGCQLAINCHSAMTTRISEMLTRISINQFILMKYIGERIT